MFEQAGGGAVDVGRSDLGVDLRMGNERLQEQLFFAVLLGAIKVQQVVDAQSVRRSNKMIDRDVGLQGAGSAASDDLQRL